MRKISAVVSLALLIVVFHHSGVAAADSAATLDAFSGKPCYQCHRSKVTAPVVHGALVDRKCIPCHKMTNGNHQSNHRLSEVKERSSRLCYECHENRSGQKSVHQPIMDNDCLGCHAPHTSFDNNLLRIAMKDLCFECHVKTLATDKMTGQATGFRDGVQSLHYLHAGKNAIPCLTCHDVHASDQQHLVRHTGKYDKETVTVIFTATSTGGNCTTSCHDALGYARK